MSVSLQSPKTHNKTVSLIIAYGNILSIIKTKKNSSGDYRIIEAPTVPTVVRTEPMVGLTCRLARAQASFMAPWAR